MKKSCQRRPITPRVPMIVVMHNIPDLSLTERLSVEAFAGGYAHVDHFDNLADCRDILTMAATERKDKQALAVAVSSYQTLISIRERHKRTGKFGATGDELTILRKLANESESFWKRQGGGTFHRHYIALKQARKQQKEGEQV